MQSTHQFYLPVKTCQVILLISVTRAETGRSPTTSTELVFNVHSTLHELSFDIQHDYIKIRILRVLNGGHFDFFKFNTSQSLLYLLLVC